jgi:hypothetical protein
MSLSTAPARPGCGCGGSGGCTGGGVGCGCGGTCGSGMATANLAATAFARPRFFAGQLLTEDDLSALTAYTTAKDRLHNRYLFGAGVVCGLWVTCDPCGGGTVTVQPGYALDCCGDDLILPCAASLDVNAMIRDLRAAQLGKDCGDPCADQGTASSRHKTASPTRRYGLYARYGEQATDPVAPYATGEPCGQVACEPTRIREGISFVLKCPADAPPPDDLWCRIRACAPNQDILGRLARLKAYSRPMVAAAATAAHPPSFAPEDAEQLTELRAGLAEARQGEEDEQIRSATEYVRKLAAFLARYDLAKDPAEYADITTARSELRAAAEALTSGAAGAGYDPLDRPTVDALLHQAADLSGLSDVRLAMLAQGRPLDDEVLADLNSDAAAALQWLLDRLDNDPMLADCELRSQAQALSLSTTAEDETPRIRSLGRAGSELAELVAGVVTDCICAALDPPCAPCEDTDVLLACLEVRDCTVVRICNAERDYVISGSALRYWLPVGLLRRRVEFFCCPPDRGRDVARAEPGRLAFSEAGFGAGESVAAGLQDLLGLPDAADLLRDAMERFGTARAGPAVPQAPPTAPAASQAAVDQAAQQIAALALRVAELTERLSQTDVKLGETETNLRETQVSLNALGSESPTPPSQAPPREPPPSQPTARQPSKRQPSKRQPTTRRRGSAAERPAPAPAASTSAAAAAPTPAAAADTQAPADAGTPSADSGAAAAGPDAPETSDGT